MRIQQSFLGNTSGVFVLQRKCESLLSYCWRQHMDQSDWSHTWRFMSLNHFLMCFFYSKVNIILFETSSSSQRSRFRWSLAFKSQSGWYWEFPAKNSRFWRGSLCRKTSPFEMTERNKRPFHKHTNTHEGLSADPDCNKNRKTYQPKSINDGFFNGSMKRSKVIQRISCFPCSSCSFLAQCL